MTKAKTRNVSIKIVNRVLDLVDNSTTPLLISDIQRQSKTDTYAIHAALDFLTRFNLVKITQLRSIKIVDKMPRTQPAGTAA